MARILITGCCSYPGPNRFGVQLGHVIDALERSHEVDVLCLREEGQAHNERMGSTRVLRVAPPEGGTAEQVEAFQRALGRQIEGGAYDIVHFRDGWSGLTVLDMQAKHGYATVFDLARSPMSEPVLSDLVSAKELERAVERSLRSSDLVLAGTESSRKALARMIEAAKIHVVPPGVNVDRFDWEPVHRDASPVVLYLGSLQPGCGIRLLLGAFSDVALESDAILVLAGHSTKTFQESVKRMVTELDLDGRVRLLGEVTNKVAPAVIARASVCVAPVAADIESVPAALFPTKLLEYMACQRAVVAPRRSSVQAFMRGGQQGLLFEPGSPKDLARTLLRLLSDSPLRARLAREGYHLVRTAHTASAARRSLRLAYDSILRLERFAEMRVDATKTASITDMGMEVRTRDRQQTVDESAFDEETVMFIEDPAEGQGEVTKVQVLPSQENPETRLPPDPSIPVDVIQDEYTDQWQSAQTGLVNSPFAEAERTMDGDVLLIEVDETSLGQGEVPPPTPALPPPRAPRLPKRKSMAASKAKAEKDEEAGTPRISGKISDDQRS